MLGIPAPAYHPPRALLSKSMASIQTHQFMLQHVLAKLLGEGLCVYAELWSETRLEASRGDGANSREPECVPRVVLSGKTYTLLVRRDNNPYLRPLDPETFRRIAEAALEDPPSQGGEPLGSDVLARTLDFVTDSFVLVGQGWEILHCNIAFQRLTGFGADELLGQALWVRCAAAGTPGIKPHLLMSLADGEAREIECWNSNSGRWLFVRMFPCTEGLSVFIQDITARKSEEETRLELERQLGQGRRMEALGTLAAGIAHDFNNVLSAVIGHAGMLREKLDAAHVARSHAEEIWVAASRARDLTGRILAYSRLPQAETERQPVKALTRESVSLLKASLPTSVTLDALLDGQEVCAQIRPSEVQQIVLNLCTNAWQAMPTGKGHVRIEVHQVEAHEALRLDTGLIKAGRYVVVSVEDDGAGMSADVRAHLFEPFFTTKARGKGTGLGLYVIAGIAHAREGGIRVTSTEGQGTRFEVFIPACEEEAVTSSSSASTCDQGRGERVAYVDDDLVVCVMVEQLLNQRGFVTTTFSNPEAALQGLLTEQFDVLVTDQNMPDMSGVELASALRARGVLLPIVLSTGLISDALRAAAKEAGIWEVVPKERSFEDLAGVLLDCIDSGEGKGASQPR